MSVRAELLPGSNGTLLPVNILEALVVRVGLGLVPSTVAPGVFTAPSLRVWRQLVLLGLLIWVLTHAVPHGRELRDLVPWSHATLFVRTEQCRSRHLRARHHIGTVLGSPGRHRLVHLVILPALPDQVAETALTLTLVLRVPARGVVRLLPTLITKLVLRPSRRPRLAGSSGAGVVPRRMHVVAVVLFAALHHVAVTMLAALVVQLLVRIVFEAAHVLVIWHLVLALIVHVAVVAVLYVGSWVLGVRSAPGYHLRGVVVHAVEVAVVEGVRGWHGAVRLLGASIPDVSAAVESWALAGGPEAL